MVEKIVGARWRSTLTQGHRRRCADTVPAMWRRMSAGLGRVDCPRGTRESIVRSSRDDRRAIEFDPTLPLRMPAGAFRGSDRGSHQRLALDSSTGVVRGGKWTRRALEWNDQERLSSGARQTSVWRRDHEGTLAEFARMIALNSIAQGRTATAWRRCMWRASAG